MRIKFHSRLQDGFCDPMHVRRPRCGAMTTDSVTRCDMGEKSSTGGVKQIVHGYWFARCIASSAATYLIVTVW